MTGICLVIAAHSATAGELKLSTVRLDLADRQPSATMTLTNTTAEKTLVQLHALSWSQASGQDATEPTVDLIVNPPIAEIEPGGRQLVRIGYVGKLQTSAEKTYRLLIEEVPRRDRERKQVVETYLKISVPIFVAPLAKPEARLSAALSRDNPATLLLRNDGTSHVRLVSYGLTSRGSAIGAPHQGLFYVLPGARLALPLDPTELSPAGPAGIAIISDEGPMQLPLRAAPE